MSKQALAAVMSRFPAPAGPKSGIQIQRELINAVRAKLNSPRIKLEKTKQRLRNTLASLEDGLRYLRGPRAQKWSEDRPGGPIPAATGSVVVGEWSYSGTSHEENRRMRSGESFLGYLENRPGIVGVLSAEPPGGRGVAAPRVEAPPDVIRRIEETEAVLKADPEKRQAVIDQLATVWGWCEAIAAGLADGDVWVEFEVDGESTRDD